MNAAIDREVGDDTSEWLSPPVKIRCVSEAIGWKGDEQHDWAFSWSKNGMDDRWLEIL